MKVILRKRYFQTFTAISSIHTITSTYTYLYFYCFMLYYRKISIRTGTTFHDLVEIANIELNEPKGWITVPLSATPNESSDTTDIDSNNNPLRTWFLQAAVISMHQNGKDTHVRQVKVFGPVSAKRRETTSNSLFTRELSSLSLLR